MKKTYFIVIAAIIIVGIYVGSAYNSLVKNTTAADTQWAQVETQYQRRFDLIPNLVAAVKGAMKQEQAVFGAIADARTRYTNAKSVNEKAIAAGEIESSFARLLVVMENYPQLKSAENVLALQSQIEGTENRISVERGRYNDAVKAYNLGVVQFPSSLIASMFGFSSRTYFTSAVGTDVAPEVKL
jgi:LemA protein